MKQLLLVAHAPSPNTQHMVDAVLRGARHPDIDGIAVRYLKPLDTQPDDLIAADAIIIGTTENLGYMAGLVKDVFDRCYYPCLEKTQAKPFTFYIRAGHDGTGTRRALESITTGLRWRCVQEPLLCRGEWRDSFLDDCKQLGMTMAASLEAGII